LKTKPADTKDKYSLSFTTGALFHRESLKLAQLYLEFGDWIAVRDIVLNKNLLQARTLNTAKRVCREVISRLKTLPSEALKLLVDGNEQERTYLLWIAVCHRYRFIADFAGEILRERYITLKTELNHEDYDAFFSRKAEWHDELDGIAKSTKGKLRQVLFKMLIQAGLLSTKNLIIPAIISPRLMSVIQQSSQQDVYYLPIHDSEIKGLRG